MDNGGSGSQYNLDELYELVGNGFDGLSSVSADGYDSLGVRLDTIDEHIQSLQSDDSDSSSAGDASVVALDSTQYQRLSDGFAVLATEGFLIVALLATICGLTCFKIFSRGWFR